MLNVDPSGELALAGALIGGGLELVRQFRENGGNFDCVDVGKVAVSAAVGALGGSTAFLARGAIRGSLSAGKIGGKLSGAERVAAGAGAAQGAAATGLVASQTGGGTEGGVRKAAESLANGIRPGAGSAMGEAFDRLTGNEDNGASDQEQTGDCGESDSTPEEGDATDEEEKKCPSK